MRSSRFMHLCVDSVERRGKKQAKELYVKPFSGNIGGSRNARLNLAALRSVSVTTVHAVI